MNGDTKVDDSGRFRAALPTNVAVYSNEIMIAGFNAHVSPWLLAGIVQRESNAGLALTPVGPAGTGDVHPRPAGRRYGGYVVGPSGMPEDGQGWGRGLCQIDWGVHNDWCRENEWSDALVNLNYAAQLLAGFFTFFAAPAGASGVLVDKWRLNGLKDARGVVLVQGWAAKYGLAGLGPFVDPRPLSGEALVSAALAAYNAGQNGVLEAVAAGLPADAPTAGNNYASWILTRVNSWESQY